MPRWTLPTGTAPPEAFWVLFALGIAAAVAFAVFFYHWTQYLQDF
jgi:hypothetical protein